MPDVLLDTSFLLPTLGIEIEEITQRDLESIKRASEKTSLCCCPVSLVEILGLLGRKFKKADKAQVDLGLRSLLDSGAYRWISPSYEAARLALELRVKGHRDNIDNILYALAYNSRMLFLSLDGELEKFLGDNGYDVDMIIGTEDLHSRLR